MADEKIVTSIVANSDFSGLIADVQRVTSSLHKLQQEFAGSNRALAGQIDAANKMFNQTMLKTGQFSSHFVSLTSDVEKFGRNLDSGRLKLRDYFRVYQDHVRTHGGLIRDLAKQQVQLQNAVLQPLGRNAQGLMQYNVHIPRGLDLTKNKASLLKQELQIMNKVIQDGGVQLINWGKNTQWAGRQLTVGLTLPLVAFGKAAADAFKVADQELTRLAKVYGDIGGATAQELAKVRKDVAATAKELSAAMGVNFAETIGLAADIAATGKTGNELLSSVSETTRLAVLGEVDRQEAMKATLAIQSAFKQNTEELADSINFLNAVENQTTTTLNDLVEAIPKAGPVIKGLGGSVQDLALYLTAMREGGINASEGANALKSALASLINPTDVAVKKFQGFGIDLLGIVGKNAGDVTATLLALQSALDRLDPLQKQQAIEQLFGKFQFSRLNALFENLGRQGSQTLQVLDLMKASAGELEAVATRELAAVTESASGRYRRAIESLRADLAGVGDQFLDIATRLVNGLSKIIEFGQKLPDPIKKLVAFGGAFTAIIGPVIMLTGVLANFFGYIIKGLGHFKALFKGAEGFKLLTPEIIAARNASEMLGNEFYSDAKAADTLRLAIERLNEDLIGLQVNATNASKASSGLGQVLITSAGTPIMPMGALGGPRRVIQGHPLLGPESRAAAHLNPRNPNDPASIFGLTLQPIPLNRKIGRTPQVIMSERLPDIEGITSVGGVSTGVVASEHARYAALMATLGVQSRQEIEALKKTIGLGGQVSQEFIATFDDILPITQRLTANAATQSAAIVADLRAGKISAEVALSRIFAANAELERMLGLEVSAYAASRGRTIDLTKAPLIDQPVVDVAGKPNTRGMFRPGIFRDVMESVGRATRTRTLGGPYSIETTQRLNKGGGVFYNNGDQVPGPNVNADVVPAMLTPGEFVIRRDVAQQDPEGMRALNEGRAMVVPFGANMGGQVPGIQYLNAGNPVQALAALAMRRTAIGGSRAVGTSSRGHARTSGYNLLSTQGGLSGGFGYANFAGRSFWQSTAGKEMSRLYGLRPATTVRGSRAQSEVNIHAISSRFTGAYGRGTGRASTPDLLGSDLISMGAMGNIDPTRRYRILPAMSLRGSKDFNEMLPLGKATPAMWQKISGANLTDLAFFLHHELKLPPTVVKNILEATANRINYAIRKNPNATFDENTFGDLVFNSAEGAIRSHISTKTGSWVGLNRGGMVPGYRRGGKISRPRVRANRGGRIPGYAGGGPVQYGYARGVQKRLLGGGILRMLAMMGLPFAGQAVGSRVGGSAGTAISTGSLLASMFMFPGMLGRAPITPSQRLGIQPPLFSGPIPTLESALAGAPLMRMTGTLQQPISTGRQSIFRSGGMMDNMSGGKLSGWMEKNATASNGWRTSLARLGTVLTRTNLIIGTVATGVAIGWNKWKQYQEALDRTRLSAGLTEESAGKLGLKFKSFSSSLGASVGSLKAFLATNKAIYEGMMKADAPFRMTIAEYKKLRKEVKGTMQDQIDLVNSTKDADLPQLAVQLKAMFVAAGMSAEEASKKVYMVFTLSQKANQAYASTLGNRAFNDIKDSATAATAAVSNFVTIMGKTGDGKAQLNALNTAWQALTSSIQSATDEAAKNAAKNNQAFDEQSEYRKQENIALDKAAEQLSRMAAEGQKVSLGPKLLNELAAANPLIMQFANQFDTVVSLMQKQRLMDLGFAGDLSSVTNPQEIAAMYDAANAIAARVEEANRTGALKAAHDEVKRLEGQKKTLENAVKGETAKQQIDRRKRIEFLQNEIEKINEAAAARKKALQEEAEDQDVNLEIQKKRLEVQQKMAAGDMAGAAQAQLDLQKLVNRQQQTLTERAIEFRRETDVAPLQAEIDKLNAAAKDIADNAALAADSLESINKKLQTQIDKIEAANKSLTAYLLNQAYGVGGTGPLAAGVKSSFQQIPGTDKYVKVTMLPKRGPLVQIVDAEGKPITTEGIQTPPPASATLPKLPISVAQNKFITPQGLDSALRGAKIPLSQGNKVGFRFIASDGKVYEITNLFGDKKRDRADGSPVELPEGAIPAHVVKPGFAMGGHIRGFSDGTTDGPVSGPGTWTSDSILARLSNGEFVTRSASVADAGVDNMNLINQKGSVGILEAAFNIINRKNGGIAAYKDGGSVESKSIFGMKFIPNTIGAMIGLANKAKGYIERDKSSPLAKSLTESIGSVSKDFALWCGVFINWLAKTTGVKLPNVTYTPAAYNAFVRMGKMYQSPRPGDIAFFDFERAADQITDHVGLVTKVSGKTITTIDGNTSSTNPRDGGIVASKIRPWGKWNKGLGIFTRGFGRPDYRPELGGVDFAPHTESDRAAAARAKNKYTAKKGDNLSDIARRNNISLKDLLNANPKFAADPKYRGGSRIFTGTKINIPKFKDGGLVDIHDIVKSFGGVSQKELARSNKNLSYYDAKIDNPIAMFSSLIAKGFAVSPFGGMLPAAHIGVDVIGSLFGRESTFGKKGFANDLNPQSYAPYLAALNQSMLQPYAEIGKGSATTGDWINALLPFIPAGAVGAIASKAKTAALAAQAIEKVPVKTRIKVTPMSKLKSAFDEQKKSGALEADPEAFNKSRFELALKQSLVAAKTNKFVPLIDLPKTSYSKLYEENLALKNFDESIKTDVDNGRYVFKFTKGELPEDPFNDTLNWLNDLKAGNRPRGEFPVFERNRVEVIDQANNKKVVAYIEYDPISGFIHMRQTDAAYQRQGWSEFLYNKAASFSRIIHSGTLTHQGAATAPKMGGFLASDLDTLLNLSKSTPGSRLKAALRKAKKKDRIVIRREDLPPAPTPPNLTEYLSSTSRGPATIVRLNNGQRVARYEDGSEVFLPEIQRWARDWQAPTINPNDGLGAQSIEKINSINTVSLRPEVIEWLQSPWRRANNFPYGANGYVEPDVYSELNRLSNIATKNPKLSRPLAADGFPRLAGGGYVNPSFYSNMSMPSFYTGAKYVYDDTIAQLHKGEMVVPSSMNPNNPFATNTGGPVSISNNLTINATPGMDTDELVNKVFTKVEEATTRALVKAGRSRTI